MAAEMVVATGTKAGTDWRTALYASLSEGYDGERWWTWGSDSLPVLAVVFSLLLVAITSGSIAVQYWLGWIE